MLIILILFILLNNYRFICLSNIFINQYYEFNRYLLFLKQNKKNTLFKFVILLASFVLCFLNEYFLLIFVLFFIFKPIKKIKLTRRMLRWFIIFSILNLLNISYLVFFSKEFVSFFILYIFILFYISFYISFLIEKIIQYKFLKKAKEKLRKYKTKIIAITGSYGKSSVKNYIYELANQKYNILISPSSYNTFNGVLLTINDYLKPHHEYLILEIGVDIKNGMNKFIRNFNFDIAIITSIGPQHLKTFKTIDNIINEKNKIFHSCTEYAILNIDDPNILCTNTRCKIIAASTYKNANVIVKNDHKNIYINKQKYENKSSLLGSHNDINLALAIAACKAMNIENNDIIKNIKRLKNIPHRLSTYRYKNWTIIDDSYNSNIQGFSNALDVLDKAENKKILITPGIVETNDFTESLLDKLFKKINCICDIVLLSNKNANFSKNTKCIIFDSFSKAFNYLKENYTNENLTILIENDVPDIFLK